VTSAFFLAILLSHIIQNRSYKIENIHFMLPSLGSANSTVNRCQVNRHPTKGLPVVKMDYKYTVGGGNKQSQCVELAYKSWVEAEAA